MKACLDPNVAVISPSLETRFLTGVALSAAVGYVLSTGDYVDISPELMEGIDESLPVSEGVLQNLLGGFASMLPGLQKIEEGGAGALTETEGFLGFLDAVDTELMLTALREVATALVEALGLLIGL